MFWLLSFLVEISRLNISMHNNISLIVSHLSNIILALTCIFYWLFIKILNYIFNFCSTHSFLRNESTWCQFLLLDFCLTSYYTCSFISLFTGLTWAKIQYFGFIHSLRSMTLQHSVPPNGKIICNLLLLCMWTKEHKERDTEIEVHREIYREWVREINVYSSSPHKQTQEEDAGCTALFILLLDSVPLWIWS